MAEARSRAAPRADLREVADAQAGMRPSPSPDATLLVSATLDSSSVSYGRHSGIRHTGSFSLAAARASSAASPSSSV